MTIRKSLLAVATASAVAVAGAGVANAAPGDVKPNEGAGSTVSSLEGADLSGQAGAIYGSAINDKFNIPQAVFALTAAAATGAAVVGSINILPDIYTATKGFQQYVDDFTGDTQAFINSFTN